MFRARTEARWADWGKDFYAAITFSDLPGRQVWLAWMNCWDYASKLPTTPWRGAMTLPRELGLRTVDGTLRLTQRPVSELESLRGQKLPLAATVEVNAGQPIELALSLKVPVQIQFASAVGMEATLAVGEGTVSLTRPENALTAGLEGFVCTHTAPLLTANLRLILDSSSMELFSEDGLLSFTELLLPSAPISSITFDSLEGVSGGIWTLNPIFEP